MEQGVGVGHFCWLMVHLQFLVVGADLCVIDSD